MNVTDVQSISTVQSLSSTADSSSTKSSDGNAFPTSQSSDVQPHSNVSDISTKKLEKTVEELNKKIAANTKVEFSLDKESHRIWVNLVDSNTGKVLMELPPEGVRKLVDSVTPVGLSFDKRS